MDQFAIGLLYVLLFVTWIVIAFTVHLFKRWVSQGSQRTARAMQGNAGIHMTTRRRLRDNEDRLRQHGEQIDHLKLVIEEDTRFKSRERKVAR